MKALAFFRTKLLAPCRKLLRIFRFKLKRPLSIKPLKALLSAPRRRRCSPNSAAGKPPSSLLSFFFSRRHRKLDRVMELRSAVSEEAEQDSKKLLTTSPITPAYIKAFRSRSRFRDEDACRSFENYLVEIVVEEGKMRDLMDVEDLIYYWKSLTCPVFIDLVCTFYGQLCKDLSAPDHHDIDIHTASSSH